MVGSTTPEQRRRRRRIGAVAAFTAFWAALLVTIGFPVLPVAGLYVLFALALAVAFEGQGLAGAVSRRARQVDVGPLRERSARGAELLAHGGRWGAAKASEARRAVTAAARPRIERARRNLTAARERRTARGDAQRLNAQAAALRHQGELDDALQAGEKALELVRALGDRRAEALTLNGIGLTQARLGDESGAVDSYEAAVAILTELGDSHGAGRVLANLGALHLDLGHEDEARVRWLDALERLEPGSPEHERTAERLKLAS